ncbi:MAG TPA: hypothetical protein VMG12_33375 [Polyangiaceae bacterium]|nr:hypothetical protein [Polyangiaceae bacterium]
MRRAERALQRLAFAMGLAVASVGWPGSARAAETSEVLIVGRGSVALSRKLRAEAAYAGLRPIGRAPQAGAPATLRVLSDGRVLLAVEGVDREQRFEQTLEARPGEREAFALRVVEQLRARLVDVGWTLPEPASSAQTAVSAEAARLSDASGSNVAADGAGAGAPTDVARATNDAVPPALDAEGFVGVPERNTVVGDDVARDAKRSASAGSAGRVWLEAGVASSWATGGLDAVPQAALGAQLELGAGWHARAGSRWPLRDAELEAAEGEARVAWTAFTTELGRALPLPEPWLAQAGVGAGLFVIDARGSGRDEFSGRRERLYAGAYFAELSLGRTLTGWLRLRASALGGITAPRPVLRFDEREVASVGRLVGSLAIGLDLSWPEEDEEAR